MAKLYTSPEEKVAWKQRKDAMKTLKARYGNWWGRKSAAPHIAASKFKVVSGRGGCAIVPR